MLEHEKKGDDDDEIEKAALLLLNFAQYKKKKVTFKNPLVEGPSLSKQPKSEQVPSKPQRSCLKRC